MSTPFLGVMAGKPEQVGPLLLAAKRVDARAVGAFEVV